MNKKITFDSDSSDDEDEDHTGEVANDGHAGDEAKESHAGEEVENGNDVKKEETTPSESQQEVLRVSGSVNKDAEEQVDDVDESKPKKPRVEDPPVYEQTDQKESTDKPKDSTEKNIDDLIDEDLKELGDRKKVSLRSKHNYIFII
jgi:tRNA acetyltransferase TAN1